MKLFALIGLAAVAALPSAASAGVSGDRPEDSIHNLPARWEGIAGDLVVRVPAVFSIQKIRKVTREETKERTSVVYEVDAQLRLGSRSVNVSVIHLQRWSWAPNHSELILKTDDEIAPNLMAIVSYDEASDTYTMRDPIQNGERRFVLRAAANLKKN